MKRTELKRKTPMKTTSSLTRSVLVRHAPVRVKKSRSTGPARAVVGLVLARDGGRCLRCNRFVGPERGVDFSLHHRLPRRSGGSRRPELNMPANLVTLCGSATTLGGCHAAVESGRTAALAGGWLLHADQVPSSVPLHAWWGPVLLDDRGRWRTPERCPGCVCDPVMCANDGSHCEEQSCGSCLHGCPVEGGCPVCTARYAEVPS
jgi:5-methylcytosine-specific restriction protein A